MTNTNPPISLFNSCYSRYIGELELELEARAGATNVVELGECQHEQANSCHYELKLELLAAECHWDVTM